MTFREITKIPIGKIEIHVGAAMYLATIVYPESYDKRTDFINACRSFLIKQHTAGRLPRRIIYKDEILAFDRKRRVDQQFNKAEKILVKKRIPSLKIMNLSFCKKVIPTFITNEEQRYRFSISKYLSLNFPTSRYAQEKSGGKYKEKAAMSRVWSSSKPILHLIGGLYNAVPLEKKPVTIEYLLLNPEWVIDAVKIAENIRKNLIIKQVISIKESDQIVLKV